MSAMCVCCCYNIVNANSASARQRLAFRYTITSTGTVHSVQCSHSLWATYLLNRFSLPWSAIVKAVFSSRGHNRNVACVLISNVLVKWFFFYILPCVHLCAVILKKIIILTVLYKSLPYGGKLRILYHIVIMFLMLRMLTNAQRIWESFTL